MYKSLIVLLFSILGTCTLAAQNDSIKVTKGFGGYKFEHNGKYVNPRAMLNIMGDNPEALPYMKKAKTNSDLSMAIGFTGGALIGWPIGTAIGGGDPNWVLAGVGAGILLLAIPTTKAFNRNALQAVDIYNSGQQGAYFNDGIKINLGSTDHGLGVKLVF